MDRRTVPGAMPDCRTCSGVKSRLPMSCGAMTSDSVEPRLAVSANKLEPFAETPCRLAAGLQVEAHDGAGLAHLLLHQRRLGMVRQARVVHTRHGRVLRKVLGNGLRRARLLAVADEIRLEAALDQERRVRIEQRAEHREIRPQAVDELVFADDRAAHHVARARGVLREAVHVQVDVELAVLVKAGEGVVDDRERAVPVRELHQSPDVGDLGDRVGRALEEHQPRRARRQRVLDAGHVLDGEHGVLDAEAREQPADDVARRAVGLDEEQDVIALLREAEQRLRDRIDARRRGEAVVAALQRASVSSSWRVVGLLARM